MDIKINDIIELVDYSEESNEDHERFVKGLEKLAEQMYYYENLFNQMKDSNDKTNQKNND